ncbi:MAG: OmpA family protein [Flavobacteriales bacterium]|nr:OmpA family protein [Flavobacteriales bacterium]
MKLTRTFLSLFFLSILITSCVSKKKFATIEQEAIECEEELTVCIKKKLTLEAELGVLKEKLSGKEDRISDLKEQLTDARTQRDAQLDQVEGLTVLSQTANRNIEETLSQLEGKDKYIKLLQAAKTKADSINLALAINLKSELRDGIEDKDIEIKVDKTVVMINLSDKMLFKSGSSNITDRADEVLEKIAGIVKSRPGFDVMVEGYTDNVPISRDCTSDNWDLSAQRAVSVVKALHEKHEISPERLIAAGRGEYNPIASNDTEEGRSTNRRTRIVIMPQLDQFYDLLHPNNMPLE